VTPVRGIHAWTFRDGAGVEEYVEVAEPGSAEWGVKHAVRDRSECATSEECNFHV
jgi:hypothetical protein